MPRPPKCLSTSRLARVQEERVARETGGRRQRGSGNQAHHRGDVRNRKTLGELKWTAAKGYRLTRETLAKIEQQALAVGAIPWWAIEFRDAPAQVNPRGLWVAIPWWVAIDVLPWLREKGISHGQGQGSSL